MSLSQHDPALRWLLVSGAPSVRFFTLTEVLDRPADSDEVRAACAQTSAGARVQALLAGQQAYGGFGVHPYQKWTGAHWRLVSLVELGIPANEPRVHAAADQVLRWLTGLAHRRQIRRINGLTRRCASQEGNALAVYSRLGLASDARVQMIAESVCAWKWPDGGWNCDSLSSALTLTRWFGTALMRPADVELWPGASSSYSPTIRAIGGAIVCTPAAP